MTAVGSYLTRPGETGVYHVIAVHGFDGRQWAVCEHAAGMFSGPRVEVVEPAADLSAWEPSTAEAFDAVMAEVMANRARVKREAEKRAEGDAYGIPVIVSHGRWTSQVTIVRCTKTRWITSSGHAFVRSDKPWRDGAGIGSQSGIITDAGRAALSAFVGDREKVDIVAERKAATAECGQ